MNYLEEAGNWLGLPSESPINESSINFFSAYTARKLKIGTNVAKFVTNYHKMDNDTIKGLESTIKLAKKQIKELEIEQEKFVNNDEKYKEKLIKKFKKYNPNKTWSDNNIKKYYKNEIEFNNKIINKCEKELKYIQVNNESYIEESLFKRKPKKNYVQPSREDYNKAISVAKRILYKEPLLKKAYKVIPYKIDKEYPDEVTILDYSFRDDRLPHMVGDEWNNFLDNIDTPAIVELEEELEKYDIEMTVNGTKDGTVSIMKYTYNTNESYTPERGEVKVNKINTLANLARNYGIENSGNLRDDIVSECTDILDCLDTVEESVVNRDISLLPVYTVNEGYAIDLDSLKYVVESKECTLQEAIQEVRDVNYIGDTIPMYCTLPKNINESITLESFITLNDSLNEAGIIPVSTREFSELEFVSEAAKLSEVFDKVKDKIKNMPQASRDKEIKKCEEKNKELREELEKVKKMSDTQAASYCKKKLAKNIALLGLKSAGVGAAMGVPAGVLIVYAPGIGYPALFGAYLYAYKYGLEYGTSKDGVLAANPTTYKQAINNSISVNNQIIKNLKAKK